MSRQTVTVKGDVYRFWVRIDGKIPEDVYDSVRKLAAHPQHSHLVKACDTDRLVIDTKVFDLVQLRLDVAKDTECSLYVENLQTGSTKCVKGGAKMQGRTKDSYDEILRMIRF